MSTSKRRWAALLNELDAALQQLARATLRYGVTPMALVVGQIATQIHKAASDGTAVVAPPGNSYWQLRVVLAGENCGNSE